MDRRQTRLWPLPNQMSRKCDFVLVVTEGEREWRVNGPLTLTAAEPGDVVDNPTFSLKYDEVQALVDQLYQCGYRPSKGVADPSAALDAVRYHLEDMRRLVFDSAPKS